MGKNLLLSIVLFTLFLSANGQCPPVNIFTRPDSAINLQRPVMTNNFNWLTQKYKLNTISATPGNDSIWSPIYQPDNQIIDHLRLSLDMLPQDGWELIRREMGYNQDGTPENPKPENPYIVMYNKYSSILRIFYARGSSAPFTSAKVTLKFNGGAPAQSSLLDLSDGLIPLDVSFARDKIFQSPSVFDNRLNQWFYADFPMQYDPCTCYYTSRLNFEIKLINQANVDISGSANGKLMAINNDAGTVNQQDKTFSFADLLGGAKKANKTFKEINKFKSDQEKALDTMLKNNPSGVAVKKLSLNLFQTALKSSGFLKAGLAAAPFIGSAISLLDFFIGGGKKTPPAGPQEVKLTPTTIDMTIKLNGTITSNHDYGAVIFWNPGSNISSYGDADYPFYNEIMGVFNLTETPIINYKRTITYVGGTKDRLYKKTAYDYRIQNPIKYVVNPAARLAIQDAQVALIVEGDSSSISEPAGGAWEMEGKDEKSGFWQYRSDYIDVNCLNKKIFKIRGSAEPNNINWLPKGKIYLKFIINFRRLLDTTGSQNVLFVAKYPVTEDGVSDIGTVSGPCSSDLFVHSTNSEINTFCNSVAYKTNRILRKKKESKAKETPNELEKIIVRTVVVPNPTSSYSSLIFETTRKIKLTIFIADALGKKVSIIANNRQYSTGIFNERLNAEKLPSGIYNIVLQNENSRIVKKLVVQR